MENLPQMLQKIPGILSAEAIPAPEAYREAIQLCAICYLSDGCRVMGYAACPAGTVHPLPCLIYNRGGNREFGILRPEAVCRFAARG